MGTPAYYAHTPPPGKRDWHDLLAHLKGVSERAGVMAGWFGAKEIAQLIGLFHDLGKFAEEFQEYLRAKAAGRSSRPFRHAIWGAAFLYHLLKEDRNYMIVAALPVLGHHAGLKGAREAEQILKQHLEDDRRWSRVLELAKRFHQAGLSLSNGLPPLSFKTDTQKELFIRLLFSALVDADFLDTEAHFDPVQARLRGGGPSMGDLWERLERDQERLMQEAEDTPVNRLRKEVYEAALRAAEEPPGLFRLTVPTGGGKTRSGLAFALKHALRHGLRRVVVALPYTSIIDQTAQVYRKILGEEAVLEHHSALELPPDGEERQDFHWLRWKLATENWDAPLVVTTTVQLFESLFSNLPSKVRKLHNLARSVILLDEVQTLPTELLEPTLDALRWLATPVEEGGFGCTVVLSSATQPVFEESRFLKAFGGLPVREIIPDYPRLFAALKRVEYEVRLKPMTWEELAEEVRGERQVMVILNTRKDALALLERLEGEEGVYHLSSLLCPAHRKEVLEEVKARLGEGCRVLLVSTQVVEAGVDLDFPVVYRAFGPLDRVVQAAGRCNREGKREFGRVVLFWPEEGSSPRGPYYVGLEKARMLLKDHPPEDLHDPGLYREYFRELFDTVDTDKKGIQPLRRALNYPEVAQRYRFIEGDTVAVVVPYGEAMERLEDLKKDPSTLKWRRLQPYLVGLFRKDVDQKGAFVEPIPGFEGLYRWTGRYDQRRGLVAGYPDPSDLIL